MEAEAAGVASIVWVERSVTFLMRVLLEFWGFPGGYVSFRHGMLVLFVLPDHCLVEPMPVVNDTCSVKQAFIACENRISMLRLVGDIHVCAFEVNHQ